MEMLTPRVTKRQTLADGIIMAISHRSYAPVASRSGNTGGRHALALQGLPRRALGNLLGAFTIQAGSLFWQPTQGESQTRQQHRYQTEWGRSYGWPSGHAARGPSKLKDSRPWLRSPSTMSASGNALLPRKCYARASTQALPAHPKLRC